MAAMHTARPARRRRAVGYMTVVVTVVLVGVVVIVLSSSGGPGAQPSAVPRLGQRLAVPAYIDPTSDPAGWQALTGARPGAVGIVVANVDNGPGSQAVPAWSAAIGRAHQAGSLVLGYVDTGYLGGPAAGRSRGLHTRTGATGMQAWLAQIDADIADWYQYYGSAIGGIFMDQSTSDCGPAASPTEYAHQYRLLSDQVKQVHPGAVTALNPGTAVGPCFRDAADVLVTFEGSYGDYTGAAASADEAYQPLTWSPSDPARIWHIVYGATSVGDLRRVMALSKSRHAGYVYVTAADPPNPFDQIPPEPYWTAEQGESST